MRVLVVENPVSGAVVSGIGEGMARVLRHKGMDVVVSRTAGRGDAFSIVSDTVAEVVVVVGGDGTLNEVVNGLFGRDVVVVPVPAGLSNVVARSLGLHTPADSLKALFERRFGEMDVFFMRCGDLERYFIGMAGFGFDGTVVEMTHGDRRGCVGFAGYLPGILQALFSRHMEMELFADGEFVGTGRFVVLANTPYYGGPFWILPHARFDDGLLDVLFSPADGLSVLLLYAGSVLGRHMRHRGVRVFRCRHLFIRPAERGHIDGEPVPSARSVEVRFVGRVKVAKGEREWRRRGL